MPPLDVDIHPLYGPLPGTPPPTSSQDQQQLQQGSRQNLRHQTVAAPPPPRSQAPAQQYNSQNLSNGGSFTHASVSNGFSGGRQVQSSSVPPSHNHYSQSSYSSSSSQRVNSGRTSLSSTSSSSEVDKGPRHPSPPYLLSQSSPNVKGSPFGGASSTLNYYSHQAPTSALTATAVKNYQSQSKDSAQDYPWQSSSSGLPTINQQVSKGAYHQQKQVSSSNQQQHAYSPSWPSTYSTSSSSLDPSSYPYASLHSTSSSSEQQQPVMPYQPLHVGHMTSPSYSDDSRYSPSDSYSGCSHTGGSSGSTFPSGPIRKDERFKDEEKSVEPNILRFTYAELSEATDGFVKDILGLGSFGTVFKAKVRGNGPYAVKKLYSVSVLLKSV